MMRTRQQLETAEFSHLAPYAQRAAESAGRVHDEPPHPYRTDFQRDCARVVHARAFRRLEYKTQVFLNGSGDHLRTRLTHTMEVASITRTIASALGANEDLAEAIALAHDLGHSPLGHAGEEVLDQLMQDHGGFEHNLQSLRIVQLIESTNPAFPGLNLAYETTEGLRKHDQGYHRPASLGRSAEDFPSPSLEAQVANLADEITYYSHDLDDGLDSQLITEEQLEALPLWQQVADPVRKNFPQLCGEAFRRYVVQRLIAFEVDQLVRATDHRLQAAGVQHADDIRRHPQLLAGYPDEIRLLNIQLRKFLYQNLYYHPAVSGPNQRACEAIEAVFHYYVRHPERLGDGALGRVEAQGLHRTVCDYVSGMTDRYVLSQVRILGLH